MPKINKYKIGEIVVCPQFMGNRQGRIIRYFETLNNTEGCKIEYEVLFVNGILETFHEKWLERVELKSCM